MVSVVPEPIDCVIRSETTREEMDKLGDAIAPLGDFTASALLGGGLRLATAPDKDIDKIFDKLMHNEEDHRAVTHKKFRKRVIEDFECTLFECGVLDEIRSTFAQ